MVFIFYKNNLASETKTYSNDKFLRLEIFEQLKEFISSEFFKTIYFMILIKDHLINSGREEIKRIITNLNSNRK
jgi:hypothetical protein